MLNSYKDLVVWQKSFALVKEIYKSSNLLPEQERFGLTSQIQRAAVSIPSNIAEGSERGSRKEYVKFLRIAQGSAVELETQLLIIRDLYNVEVGTALATLTEIQKMLATIIKKLKSNT